MSSRRPPKMATTADRILDVAERLAQVQGFNGFSYADISAAVGIRKASLHHHFATKEALGVALIARYHQRFSVALHLIYAGSSSARTRLEKYVELYASVLRKGRMCLCGMLAADAVTQPASMRSGVAKFFSDNEKWLTAVLRQGQQAGEITFAGTPESMAAFLVSSLEGAMLVARVGKGIGYFALVRERILSVVSFSARHRPKPPTPTPRPSRLRKGMQATR